MSKRSADPAQPSLDEMMEQIAAMGDVPVREKADEPAPGPPARVSSPAQTVRWEDWSIGTKASAEDKADLAKELVARLHKGENNIFALRYDCIIFGVRTGEGVFLYDCSAKRRAVLK